MKVVGRQIRHKDLGSGGLASKEAYFLDLFSFHPTFFNYLSYSLPLEGKKINVMLLKNSEDGEIASACNSQGGIPGEDNIHQ